MRKIILLLGLLLAVNNTSYAACDYSCTAPYNMNAKYKTFFSAISGYNSFVENKAESILEKEIAKFIVSDNLKVDIESFSPGDLKNGIFKSSEITANDLIVNDIHLSYLNLSSLCDFNYIKSNGSDVTFMEDFPMSFDIVMTQDDINRTMKHERYQKIVKDINKLAAKSGVGLQIESTTVAIKANKFYYIIGVNVPFVRREQKLVFESELIIKNGNIDFHNTKLVSGPFKLDLKKVDFIMNYLNPLDFSVNIVANKKAEINVKNVEIKDNQILTDGIIIIPKD